MAATRRNETTLVHHRTTYRTDAVHRTLAALKPGSRASAALRPHSSAVLAQSRFGVEGGEEQRGISHHLLICSIFRAEASSEPKRLRQTKPGRCVAGKCGALMPLGDVLGYVGSGI
jgi:hypothetical protein